MLSGHENKFKFVIHTMPVNVNVIPIMEHNSDRTFNRNSNIGKIESRVKSKYPQAAAVTPVVDAPKEVNAAVWGRCETEAVPRGRRGAGGAQRCPRVCRRVEDVEVAHVNCRHIVEK